MDHEEDQPTGAVKSDRDFGHKKLRRGWYLHEYKLNYRPANSYQRKLVREIAKSLPGTRSRLIDRTQILTQQRGMNLIEPDCGSLCPGALSEAIEQ